MFILGNHQVEGINYFETFASVKKMVNVLIVLVVDTAKRWEFHQMDIHNAFLYGDLQEKVLMKPPDFHSSQPRKQHIVRSSAEDEYRSMANTACQLKGVK